MKHCKDCKESIFNQKWGEYRCKKRGATIYDTTHAENCKYYEEVKKNDSKS